MTIAYGLVEQGAVSGRPGLGVKVQTLSTFCREYWDLTYGLEILSLETGGAAEKAGLLEGDILLSLEGEALTQLQQLHEALLLAQPGQEMTMEVFRAGKIFTVTLPVVKTAERGN
jgi:serine protease Do